MKYGMNGVRVAAVAIMLAAVFGMFGSASAQEATVEAIPSPSVYVAVSCYLDEASGTTSCDFTPVADGGAAVYGLTVPGSAFCAPLAGDGSYADVYLSLPGGSGSVVFAGSVSAGGGASYSVDTDAGSITAPGDGLVCAPVPEEPVVEAPVVDADVQGGAVAVAADEEFQEPVVEEEPAVTDEVIVDDVTVTVYAYDCTSDPNGADPATYADCTPSEGIGLSATADDDDAGTTTTDVNGWASFLVPDGSSLIISEDLDTLPDGFEPYGNGVALLTAAADSVVVFIHLEEPLVGRLQIVNGTCPTAGDDRTEFRVIEPRSVAMADAPACETSGGTLFTILGGTLADGGITVMTDSEGAWRGYLPEGTYTVVDDSGASADVTVIVDDISVVVVVDYVSSPLGVLNVSRFTCDVEDGAGIEIVFYGDEPSVGDDDGCEPVDGSVTIDVASDVSSASVVSVDLGSDGVEEIELEPGDYTLTDDDTGESADFTIDGGTRLYAVIQDLVVSDDGVGNPGGEGPGGENPGGEDPGGNPAPGDGTGGTPTDGTGGNPAPGSGGDGGTDGGVNAGDNTDTGDDALNVSQLPATGVQNGETGQTLLIALLTLSGGLVAGAVAVRRMRPAA